MWWPVAATAVVLALCYLWMPAVAELRDEVGYMLRVTARVGFVCLMLAYVARPLVQVTGRGRGLLRHRRYLGLSFALAHTIHFGYVASLVVVLGETIEPFVAVFGGLAFVLLWVMAATSNNASVRLLGKNWRRLHLVGMHYLWLIFMQSFAGRLGPADEYHLYAGLFGLGAGGAFLRAYAFYRRRWRAVSSA